MLIVLINLSLIAIGLSEPLCSVSNVVIINVNESKIIDLQPTFEQGETIQPIEKGNLSFISGHVQENHILFKDALTYSFDTLIDIVILGDDFFAHHVRLALLGRVGKEDYRVDIVEVSKYASSTDEPKIVHSFKLFPTDDLPNTKGCYSIEFLKPSQVVVDCSYQENPSIVHNIFLYATFTQQPNSTMNETQIQMKQQSNLNVAQVNSVEGRKIRILKQGDTKMLVRGHLKVDLLHQNSSYVEIFTYKDEQFELEEIIDDAFLTLAYNRTFDGWVKDFQTTESMLIVLTSQQFMIFGNQLQLQKVVPLLCDVSKFALEVNEDGEFMIYAACANQIHLYSSSAEDWILHYQGIEDITSVYLVSDYSILLNKENQTIVIDMGGYENIMYQKAGCSLIGTPLENKVIQVCTIEKTINEGQIIPAAIFMNPTKVIPQPIMIDVDKNTNQTLQCKASYEVIVVEGDNFKLVDVVMNDNIMKELDSDDFEYAHQTAYISYSDLVVGPDVTFTSGKVNGKSMNIGDRNEKFYTMSQLNITLGESMKIIKIHQLSSSSVQVFIQDVDRMFVSECAFEVNESQDLEGVSCTPYPDVTIPCAGMIAFQSVFSLYRDATMIGVQYESKEINFYEVSRAGSLSILNVNSKGPEWSLVEDLLVTYGKNISNISIYRYQDSTFKLSLEVPQSHFYDLLDTKVALPWCISVTAYTVYITTQKGIILMEKYKDQWHLLDVHPNHEVAEFCHTINDQFYLGTSSAMHVYGIYPQFYYRGSVPVPNSTFVTSFVSDNYVYLTQLDQVLQYDSNQDYGLQSSLKRVVRTNDSKSACSLDTLDLLYSNSGVYVLHYDRYLLVTLHTTNNEFLQSFNVTATFTNKFNQTITVRKVEKVIDGYGTIKVVGQQNGHQLGKMEEIAGYLFTPEDLFSGPLIDLSVLGGHVLINRVHEVDRATHADVQDLTFYEINKVLMLQLNIMVATDLTEIISQINIPVEEGMKLSDIFYDQKTQVVQVISEDSEQRPNSLYYGSLAQGVENLNFTQIHLRQDWTSVIKHICVGPYTLVLYRNDKDVLIQVLRAYKDNVQQVLTQSLSEAIKNITKIIDFDAHVTETGIHILILDEYNGVFILEYSKTLRGRFLQNSKVKSFKIRQDLIEHYNQAIFKDTRFNGIHVLKGLPDKNKVIRAFISTNNALQYQLNFDIYGESFTFVSSFMRLGVYHTIPQQVQYMPKSNSVSVVYSRGLQNWAAFYNLTDAHKVNEPIPYYQLIQISAPIGKQFIKVSDVDVGLLLFRSADEKDDLVVNEISDTVQILFDMDAISGEKFSIEIQAEGLYKEVFAPINFVILQDDLQLDDTTATPQENSKTSKDSQDKQDDKIQLSLFDRRLLPLLYVVGGLMLLTLLFLFVRAVRRYILIRRLKNESEGMQGFQNDEI